MRSRSARGSSLNALACTARTMSFHARTRVGCSLDKSDSRTSKSALGSSGIIDSVSNRSALTTLSAERFALRSDTTADTSSGASVPARAASCARRLLCFETSALMSASRTRLSNASRSISGTRSSARSERQRRTIAPCASPCPSPCPSPCASTCASTRVCTRTPQSAAYNGASTAAQCTTAHKIHSTLRQLAQPLATRAQCALPLMRLLPIPTPP